MISSIEFPHARVDDLDRIHELVDDTCRRVQLDESVCYALRLCIEEAFVNVINHGYPPEKPGPITVTLKSIDRSIHAVIADRAQSFHPENAPRPDLDLGWDERQIGGLGWHFIRELMNEVRYEASEENGNILTLVKYLDPVQDIKKGRLEITISSQGNVQFIELGGKLDALSAPSVSEMLKNQMTVGKYKFVVEMARVNYISSAGVFALLNALKATRVHGGDLRVTEAPKDVHRVLELSGFFDLTKHFHDVESALASFA